MEQLRLDKLLASHGRGSRKEVKALIRGGRVSVNGKAASSGADKVGWEDRVAVDGKPLNTQKHLLIMLNKPAGTLSATRDKRAPTVLDLLPGHLRREGLFPVGRLDRDTEGLLLITDDGELAHRLLSPRRHVPKTYLVRLNGPFDAAALTAAFARGVELDGGDKTSPAQLAVLRQGEEPEVEVTIYEGMFHQVKRMFAAHGLGVSYLKRIRMGPLRLDEGLAPGACRELTAEERAQLDQLRQPALEAKG